MKNYFVQIQEILKILLIICVFHVCRPGLCIPGPACAHNGKLEKKKEKQIEPRTLCFRGRRANHMLTAALWNRENKP